MSSELCDFVDVQLKSSMGFHFLISHDSIGLWKSLLVIGGMASHQK